MATSGRDGAQGRPVVRHVDDDERRARLGVRHALAAPRATPEEVAVALVVLHATDPGSVHLSCWARMPDGVDVVAEVDRALATDRTLVKQLAMRRTLFAAPRDLLGALWPSAAARVARTEGLRMAQDVERAGLADDGQVWLGRARAAVLAALADEPDGLLALQVRQRVPELQVRLDVAPSASWTGSRVLTHLGATGDVLRGRNEGGWRTSRPRWLPTAAWLDPVGGPPPVLDAAAGYRELVRRWLAAFGPGTEEDVVWWLGATKAAARQALDELGAVVVTLDGDRLGWLLPDDVDPVGAADPWVALLPVLDPTVMGWKGRGWYLGDLGPQLFDRNGNAGPTAWVDGRVVGGWTRGPSGELRLHLLVPVADDARRGLVAQAERLGALLEGTEGSGVITTPLGRAAAPG
ncbi:winged helix DNA-binding domain-containing protein [Pseudokineococcus basanitobsidens]|uniref:Winged helix DNA-binding domain-containing protein n=1 Tax=Pseudokineococcus basanitobsidens TaxID=1926649 RepID=A0ABU8RFT0_9ACTN